jgi:hypothetical protein
MWPRRGKREGNDAPADVYIGLRSQLLTLDPTSVGLQPSADLPTVWGALMEMGFPEGAATIVSLADGTTSMVLGYSGTRTAAADEKEVASMQHPLSRLYAAGQDVITALREAEESSR